MNGSVVGMNRNRVVDIEGDLPEMPQNQCLVADCNVCFPDWVAHARLRASDEDDAVVNTREMKRIRRNSSQRMVESLPPLNRWKPFLRFNLCGRRIPAKTARRGGLRN